MGVRVLFLSLCLCSAACHPLMPSRRRRCFICTLELGLEAHLQLKSELGCYLQLERCPQLGHVLHLELYLQLGHFLQLEQCLQLGHLLHVRLFHQLTLSETESVDVQCSICALISHTWHDMAAWCHWFVDSLVHVELRWQILDMYVQKEMH